MDCEGDEIGHPNASYHLLDLICYKLHTVCTGVGGGLMEDVVEKGVVSLHRIRNKSIESF